MGLIDWLQRNAREVAQRQALYFYRNVGDSANALLVPGRFTDEVQAEGPVTFRGLRVFPVLGWSSEVPVVLRLPGLPDPGCVAPQQPAAWP